jgi:D-xylonolactonase
MADRFEKIVDNGDRCGEGPLWDFRLKRMIWTDIPASVVYSYDPRTGKTDVISRGASAGGLALRAGGGYLLVGPEGLHRVDAGAAAAAAAGQTRPVPLDLGGKKPVFNDCVVDPHGRLYVGAYYWGDEMIEPGTLYLVDEKLNARPVAENIELSNGLGLSPDNKTLYFADSTAGKILAFDVNPTSGELKNRRTFANVPLDEGLPDGLTVDSDGFVWCAQWYAARVVRYDPDGKVERRVKTPAKQTSSCAFGGEDLTDLYITTAAEHWPSRFMPKGYDATAGTLGGALYRIRLDDLQGRRENEAII